MGVAGEDRRIKVNFWLSAGRLSSTLRRPSRAAKPPVASHRPALFSCSIKPLAYRLAPPPSLPNDLSGGITQPERSARCTFGFSAPSLRRRSPPPRSPPRAWSPPPRAQAPTPAPP